MATDIIVYINPVLSCLFVCLSFFPHKQEMLYRRLQKLQQLVTCTSQLDKAKPQKKEEVGLCLCDCVVLAAS